MARFRRAAAHPELEDHQRRSGFLVLDPLPLLRELHDFYLPLAEEGELGYLLQAPDSCRGLPVTVRCYSKPWPTC